MDLERQLENNQHSPFILFFHLGEHNLEQNRGSTKFCQFLYDLGICQFKVSLGAKTVILTTITGYFHISAVSHKEKRRKINPYHKI